MEKKRDQICNIRKWKQKHRALALLFTYYRIARKQQHNTMASPAGKDLLSTECRLSQELMSTTAEEPKIVTKREVQITE